MIARSLLVLLFIATPIAPALAQAADLCRELVEDLTHARVRYIDAGHRAMAEAAYKSLTTSGKQQDWNEHIRRLRAKMDAERQAGRTEAAATYAVDLLQFGDFGLPRDEVERLRGFIRGTFNRVVGSQAAAEAFLLFARHRQGNVDDAEHRSTLRKALEAHRRHFGEHERQVAAWHQLYDDASDGEKLSVARAYAAAAVGMNAPRALFEARLKLLKHLPRTDPLYNATSSAIVPLALALARMPVTSRDDPGVPCFSNYSDHVTGLVAAMTAVASEDEKREFIKRAAVHLARGLELESHAHFVFDDWKLVVAARAVDFDAFLDAMAMAGDPAECDTPGKPLAVCGLLRLAKILLGTNHSALAIVLLQDAVELAASKKADAELAWRARIALADAEWRHGRASLAATAVAAMDVADVEKNARTDDIAIFHRLRAEAADATLDPATALKSFASLVDRALAEAGKKSDVGSPYEFAITEAASTLVERHLRRHFCLDCGGIVADPARRWMLEQGGVAERYLFQRLLPAGAFTPAEAQRLEQRLVEFYGKRWTTVVEMTKKRMPAGTAPAAITRAVALATLIATPGDDELNTQLFERVLRFLTEPDLAKKTAFFKDKIQPDMLTSAAEDGFSERYQDIFDDIARHLSGAGYYVAARSVLEILADELGLAKAPNAEAASSPLRTAKSRAFFWTSVHARIGSLAMAGKDYRAANASLDTAYRIATARLDDEWATSAERVGLLLRELKPALRLLAQTRIVVGAAGGADARPDNAFEELQLAMLGETAAGLQAAERRRLTAEPALAAALKARDAAGARLDFLKAFDEAVGTLDEATRDADRAKATQSLATAKQAVDALLPMSESLASLKPLSLAQARSLMRPDEALLLLHAGSDAVYGSLVTQKGEPLFWRSPIALAELDRRVAALRKGLDVQGRIPDFPLADAHALYRLLLGPAAARLDEARSLMVVGDGPLLSFPLAVLPRELPARMPERPDDYRDAGVKWLGLSHAIAYLPTLRALEPRRSGRLASRAKFQFAGVGNPILADGAGAARAINFAEAFRKDSLADVEVLRRAASLPETETELRAVSRLVGGRDDDLFLQARASEPLVRKNGLADYRIIMFATHGLMGGELAGMAEPGLVLTPPAEASAEDDGLLTASEIMALRLDADLVILSACNTAAADGRPRAEGFSGLPRAFLSAGARNVVVTHWAIPSQPAVVVTSRMMEERARDPDLTWSEALRRSFAHVIGEAGPASFAHPSNWAAFSLVGPATGTAR